MYPSSNQPAKLHSTAKTHKFNNLKEITANNLKSRPIIAQTETYTYKTAQVISDYLKPLYQCNKYIIDNTQTFPKLIQTEPPLLEREELISYDVESLFTNVPVHKTIEFIID